MDNPNLPVARPSASRPARHGATLSAALVATILAGCSGGGSDANATPGTGGDFQVLQTIPANNGRLFLNESIAFDFSNPVDLGTADLNSVSFTVLDLNGNALTEQPRGTFEVVDTPGDAVPGRRLQFSPRFPTNGQFDDGGFRPGRRYLVQLVSGSAATTLTDINGRLLEAPVSFQFDTADGTTPFELFRDTIAGGPRRTGFSVTQLDSGMSPLNLLGGTSVEVRIDFDQPLNPSTINLATNLDPDPTIRSGQARGRIFMQIDDGVVGQPIPATVELARNTLQGSTVILRPIGVLPNNAEIEVIALQGLQDLSGESIGGDFEVTLGTFRTVTALQAQYDAVVENFNAIENTVNFDAPLLEPQAAITAGKLTSTFAFDGEISTLNYAPTAAETVLNTNFTSIQPVGAAAINVAGGVFRFANVTIPSGRVVQGSGPNPMVWLVTGDFTVNGELSVSGGDGGRVDTLNSANFPTPGGIGVCEGGGGGDGSPISIDRSVDGGEAGFGPKQRPGRGGLPGELFCVAGTGTGSGGGGGSYREIPGDMDFRRTGAFYTQLAGDGGSVAAVISGGAAGPTAFTDARTDNNFFGQGVNVFGTDGSGLRIRGELLAPRGGAGGGGGGDKAVRCTTGDSQFFRDRKGGGGGAGGGVLIIQALGKIVIGAQGVITSEGGHGGGGEQAGSNDNGGGGGGGSGGMIILAAAGGIEITRHVRENPADGLYRSQESPLPGNSDSFFAISADGGISTQGDFSNEQVLGKYVGFNQGNFTGRSTGGFGGLGVIQLLTNPGNDSEDGVGTGNALDDNVRFFNEVTGQEVSPAQKIALLGWRGHPSADGVGRIDDDGNLITTMSDGDIRPAPILLPIPFGPTQSARSRWIDLGAVRRELGSAGPGVINEATLPRPDFEFGGVITGALDPDDNGFVSFDSTGVRTVPLVVNTTPILTLNTDASFQDTPAYSIRVNSTGLSTVPENRYANYRAEIASGSGARLVDFRILAHSLVTGTADTVMFLEPTATFPTDGVGMRVIARFFEISTDGQVGLGPVVSGGPRANVRVRFALHTNPTSATGMRFPAGNSFSGDIADLLQQAEAVDARPGFVMWDVLFDQRFRGPPQIDPNLPVQTLDSLVLPFRF